MFLYCNNALHSLSLINSPPGPVFSLSSLLLVCTPTSTLQLEYRKYAEDNLCLVPYLLKKLCIAPASSFRVLTNPLLPATLCMDKKPLYLSRRSLIFTKTLLYNYLFIQNPYIQTLMCTKLSCTIPLLYIILFVKNLKLQHPCLYNT